MKITVMKKQGSCCFQHVKGFVICWELMFQ